MAYLLARRSYPSSTLSANVRARAGLTQEELGDLLGVGRAQVAHVEAGRRGYSAKAQARLHRLTELLPARLPEDPATAETGAPPGPTLGEQAALRRRLRECRHRIASLVYAEQGRPPLTAALALRRQALTALRAALAAEADTTPTPAAEPTREAAWLELVELATARVARRQPTPTALAWTALRLRLLREEEAGLLLLLNGGAAQATAAPSVGA